MKPSEAFKKGNPLKSYEVQKARGQKSLQKYKNQAFQGKKDDRVHMNKFLSKNRAPENVKNNSLLNSISCSKIPAISTFQKKIRQAIQARYQKSKIKEFKYNNQTSSWKNQDFDDSSTKSPSKILIGNESEQSEDMEDMKKFSYLKNQQYVSIHQYQASKANQKRQSTILKESIRKRKFKIVNSKSIQAKESLNCELTKSIQKLPIDIQEELNSLSPKESKPMQVDLKVLRQKFEQGRFDQEKRKSLTSRPIDGRNQVESLLNSDSPFDQIQPKANLKTNSYIIKDTFKLKNIGKFNKNKDQSKYLEAQSNPYLSNYVDPKSGRNQNSKRRFLIQKKQTNQRNIQTQTSQQSQKKINLNHQSIPKTQNKKVFSRKIQTQLIQQPQTHQKRTPPYKNTKERIKNQPSFINDFQNHEKQLNHSSTQQKWKLEEISFRFKAMDEQKTKFPVEKINNFIEQNEKALKMGFSFEKAYKKILSGRKTERKQTPTFDTRKTIKNQQNIKRIEAIVHQASMNREERSLSKNKRRRLRLRTEADFESEKPSNQGNLTVKNSNKIIESPQNSTMIETQLKESIKNSRDRQKREFLTTNYRSKQKVDRFSTIN